MDEQPTLPAEEPYLENLPTPPEEPSLPVAPPPELANPLPNPMPGAPEPAPLPADPAPELPSPLEKVDYVRPSQMRPDPYQPRVSPLPDEIRGRFFADEIDPYQAAREWIAHVARHPDGHAKRLARLAAMGASLESNGQINPITGYWEGEIFRIETGEQRFWSTVIHSILAGAAEEPLLRVTLSNSLSRERQVVENRHFFSPSAVTQAREIATLILERLRRFPLGAPAPADDGYAYFRQVLEIPRLPNGIWDEVGPLMQLSRRRMAQILSILRLPGPLLDLADLYDLPDGTLRLILSRPEEQWGALLQHAIEERLAAKEVDEDFSGEDALSIEHADFELALGKPHPHLEPSILATRGIRRFHKAVARSWRMDARVLDRVADEIFTEGQAGDVAAMLEELAQLLRIRLEANPTPAESKSKEPDLWP